MSKIQIQKLEDVQEGDLVTVELDDGLWSGPVKTCLDGGLLAAGYQLRYTDGTPGCYAAFVSAYREVPELPTKPGSVIFVHEFDGHRTINPPALAIRVQFESVPWVLVYPNGHYGWFHPDRITKWEFCKTTPEGVVRDRTVDVISDANEFGVDQ